MLQLIIYQRVHYSPVLTRGLRVLAVVRGPGRRDAFYLKTARSRVLPKTRSCPVEDEIHSTVHVRTSKVTSLGLNNLIGYALERVVVSEVVLASRTFRRGTARRRNLHQGCGRGRRGTTRS